MLKEFKNLQKLQQEYQQKIVNTTELKRCKTCYRFINPNEDTEFVVVTDKPGTFIKFCEC